MKDIVAPAAKLGGQMVKGMKPFDAEAAAKALNEISGVPDKYVKLFPKGTAHGEIADSEAKADRISRASRPRPRSSRMPARAQPARQRKEPVPSPPRSTT